VQPTRYQRRSPAYAAYYYKQAAEDNQREYDEQQRAKVAEWAETSGYLGNEGQLASLTDPSIQAQPGTGIYAKGFNPERKEMMLRNQQALMSGNKAMQEQGMSQMGAMQDSRNTGINQIDLSKWKKENTPSAPSNPYANVYTGADNRRYGTNLKTGQTETLPGGADVRQAPAAKVDIHAPKETFKNETVLRKEFNSAPTTTAFKEVQNSYDQVTGALKHPSAANDLVAATKFMKILDPGSVVRESELMMAMEATGKLDYVMNTANRVVSGEKLTDRQRADFMEATELLYNAAGARYDDTVARYRQLAKDYGYSEDRVAKTRAPAKSAEEDDFDARYNAMKAAKAKAGIT